MILEVQSSPAPWAGERMGRRARERTGERAEERANGRADERASERASERAGGGRARGRTPEGDVRVRPTMETARTCRRAHVRVGGAGGGAVVCAFERA